MSEEIEYEYVYEEWIDRPLVNDRVLAVVDLIAQDSDAIHYSLLLHAIVDDCNLEDHCFEGDYVTQTYAEVSDHERAIFDALKALSEQERVTAVAIENGALDRYGRPLA